jgi:AbrB family looped-hinge helix DNA binding protein
MAEVTISSKNQIVIPREVREKLGVKAGDKLLVVVHDGRIIVMQKPKSYPDAIRGLARGVHPADYLEKERDSWD